MATNGERAKCSLPSPEQFDTIRPMTQSSIRVEHLYEINETAAYLCGSWLIRWRTSGASGCVANDGCRRPASWGANGRSYLLSPSQAGYPAAYRPLLFGHAQTIASNLLANQEIDFIITHPFNDTVRQTRAATFVEQLRHYLDMRQLWGGNFALGYQARRRHPLFASPGRGERIHGATGRRDGAVGKTNVSAAAAFGVAYAKEIWRK